MKNILVLGFHTLFTIAFLFMAITLSHPSHRYISGTYNGDQESHMNPENVAKEGLGMELYPTGSNLPDCSHACESCFPCKRVMVGFKCSTESCPIVYMCLCKGKYYHVPSN
ncbi:protein EPIDERMAL PATTERNING FACTOR 2-like [Camellia sinensis]|uniref:protein EPIDERMAL PATTERNING FACTOR 2-like n=1 Tax=Camellia sinensis TaxID=4442 RepID=UPI0010364CBE|nr:protein EPIDERMAL PATTERNING FACTOR 2-like [Camellia sinensis]